MALITGNKFFRRKVTLVSWVPTIASNTLVPTIGEAQWVGMSATATRIKRISAINGFSYTNTPIQVGDLDDNFDPEIVGVDTLTASSLEMFELKSAAQDADTTETATMRTLLALLQIGNIVIYWGGVTTPASGPAVGSKAEAWAVQSGGPARLYDLSPVGAKWRNPFAPQSRPNTDAVVSA